MEKNKGYNFLYKICLNKSVKFKNEFYYLTNIDLSFKEPSCLGGRLSKIIHELHNCDSIPLNYQYFPVHTNLGGELSVNYRPISEYDVNDTENSYYELCSEEGTEIDIIQVKLF